MSRLIIQAFLCLLSLLAFRLSPAQPLASGWEKLGPIEFTAAARQSPSRIVLTTSHGTLYITEDDGETWRRQQLDATLNLQAIAFADSLHGIVLPMNGNARITEDGGSVWRELPIDVVGKFYVAYTSPDTLHLTNFVGNIYRSTDRGASWNKRFTVSDTATSTADFPTRMVFTNSKRGYVLRMGGTLASTSDGGEHWIATPMAGGAPLTDIAFGDDRHGVVSAWGNYYTTSDGGAAWQRHEMPQDFVMYNQLSCLRYYNERSFFAFGRINGYIYHSTDHGATYTPTELMQAPEVSSVIETPSGWLALGEKGTLLRGVVGEKGNAPKWSVIAQCHLGDSPMIHGSNGAVLQATSGSRPSISLDSGALWRMADLRYNGYSGMHFPAPDTGYLFNATQLPVGMMTVDSGQTWRPVEMHSDMKSGGIGKISFANSHEGFAISDPHVLHSLDAGLNWRSHAFPERTVTELQDYAPCWTRPWAIGHVARDRAVLGVRNTDTLRVHAPDKSPYYDSRSYIYLHWTEDGGQNWNRCVMPPMHAANTIYFLDESDGWITSDSGRAYRSKDGGKSWELLQLAPSDRSLNDVRFLNTRDGFISMDSAGLLSTTDGGESWSYISIPTTQGALRTNTTTIAYPDAATILVGVSRTMWDEPKIMDYGIYRARLASTLSSVATPPAASSDLQLLVYPNPARDRVSVRLSSTIVSAVARLRLFDASGRTQSELYTLDAETSLDVSSIPAGSYLLSVELDGESATHRLNIVR